jgi:flagellar biosynthesis protein FlhB
MADSSKTEKPTPKKIRESREKGQSANTDNRISVRSVHVFPDNVVSND